MSDPAPHARYSCDQCRSRKIACSREASGCKRCRDEQLECVYSRSGVIRRNRKRKHEVRGAGYPTPTETTSPSTPGPTHGPEADRRSAPADSDSSGGGPQSHLATDIEVARERLRGLDTNQHSSLGALSSLSKACASTWHDAAGFNQPSRNQTFFLFEDHAEAWVNAFSEWLHGARPLFSPAPQHVLDNLRASRPDKVHDRAWLVMYYSILLSRVSSTDPRNEITKARLRCNLWLSMNDVRLLLEPSEANIQALAILATHVEEFTTPSLSWMLTTTACRMLQALGVSRRLPPHTRERRTMMFWHLNLLDKGLSIVFARPPTFHRAMAREIPLPRLEDLLPMKPHLTPACANAPSSFGMHFFHHMMLLSRIIGDIWYCIYEEAVPNEDSIESVSRDLENWFLQAKMVLEAAAMAEKPFLDAQATTSVDLGLTMLNFQHHHLHVLLDRASTRRKEQCIDFSKRMLCLLDNMVSDSEEPYNGIVWQLICCPFTPFLVLFGHILSNRKDQPKESDQDQQALAAMERLPAYLSNMALRNSLAAKLERVATILVQHTRSVIYPQEQRPTDPVPNLPGPFSEGWPPNSGATMEWDTFLNQAMAAPVSSQPLISNLDTKPDELANWANEFGDNMFDWIGWDTQVYTNPGFDMGNSNGGFG